MFWHSTLSLDCRHVGTYPLADYYAIFHVYQSIVIRPITSYQFTSLRPTVSHKPHLLIITQSSHLYQSIVIRPNILANLRPCVLANPISQLIVNEKCKNKKAKAGSSKN